MIVIFRAEREIYIVDSGRFLTTCGMTRQVIQRLLKSRMGPEKFDRLGKEYL